MLLVTKTEGFDIADLETGIPVSEEEFSDEEKDYIRELDAAVLALDTYLAHGPGFSRAAVPAKGSPAAKVRRDWVVGFSKPLKLAGVARIDLQAAAQRFMARGGDFKYFPTPPQFIDCANAVRAERLAREPDPLPLPAPAEDYSSEKWRALRREARAKLKLPPLDEA